MITSQAINKIIIDIKRKQDIQPLNKALAHVQVCVWECEGGYSTLPCSNV